MPKRDPGAGDLKVTHWHESLAPGKPESWFAGMNQLWGGTTYSHIIWVKQKSFSQTSCHVTSLHHCLRPISKWQDSAALLTTLWWEPGSQEVKPGLPSPMQLQKKPKLLITVGWIKCLSALMHLILSLSTPQLWENLSPVVKVIFGAKGNFCQKPRVMCTIRIQQLSAAVFWDCVSYKTKKASCHSQRYWCKKGKRLMGSSDSKLGVWSLKFT